MVSQDLVRSANAELNATLPSGFVAVFLGATSGIGLNSLKQLVAATNQKSPRLYIVGRSEAAFQPTIRQLQDSNSSANITFIETDVSLVKNVDVAVAQVAKSEDKVDLLYLSTGFVSFEGRQETAEGLDTSMAVRFYSRARAVYLLLPLLQRSAMPHVLNVLSGGQEGKINEQDLDLARPGNYSIGSANAHVTTMLTLVLERLASENPKISFVHSFPGLVATPVLTRGSSGLVGLLMRWIVVPFINTFVAERVEDAGAKALFYATNARYSVQETADLATPLQPGSSRAGQTAKGVFLVNDKGETAQNESLLGELRASSDKVWEHTRQVWERVCQ